jgi:hypothetical protein
MYLVYTVEQHRRTDTQASATACHMEDLHDHTGSVCTPVWPGSVEMTATMQLLATTAAVSCG